MNKLKIIYYHIVEFSVPFPFYSVYLHIVFKHEIT